MKEIQRISMTDATVKSIKENILSGIYCIGDKLPTENQFCTTLGVSRTVVREALRVLTALGYASIKPGRGAFVARTEEVVKPVDDLFNISKISFQDLMEVRISIEEISVRLAIERGSNDQIDELFEIHDSFLEANAKRDSVRMLIIDELFHSSIAKMTDNALLVNINQQLSNVFKQYRGSSFINEDTYGNAIEPHERILDAFRMHDTVEGVQAMHEHMTRAIRDIESMRG